MDLLDKLHNPDRLCRHGFTKHVSGEDDGELTWDPDVRTVTYHRALLEPDSRIKLIIEVQYELTVHDDSHARYVDNLDYYFEGCFLSVVEQDTSQVHEAHNEPLPREEYQISTEIGRMELKIRSLREVNTWCSKF